MKTFALSIATLLFVFALLHAAPKRSIDHQNEHLYQKGRYVYEQKCIFCHGKYGKGDGAWGVELKDRPRDFRTGVFKFTSTPPGKLPSDEDLIRTIRGGITGTAMPAFQDIQDRELEAVIAYIKNLSSRWNDSKQYAKKVKLPKRPSWFDDYEEREEHATQGRVLFQSTCMPCHGEEGDGQGPASAALIDTWGNPITPGDLTLKHHKSGDRPEDLYRTIALGLDGTPMVGYKKAFKPAAIWDLVAFIKSIESEENAYKE